jgi:bifunctional DNA-binding transcriptional regulator/antitoxin component of YhaV-PrlF toxin-antitoxin module
MKLEKGEMRIIELHMVLDENGKVKIPQNLLDALGIKPGDMLSFYFDDNGVTVKGEKKPTYFHADTIAPARGSLRQTLSQSTDHTSITQMSLFGESHPQQPPKKSPRRK